MRRSSTADLRFWSKSLFRWRGKRSWILWENFGVYEDATIEECFAETARAPVGTKWIDVSKGTAENPNICCRLVARDFKPKGQKDRADLFASMPPLEARRFSSASQRLTKMSSARADGSDRSSCSSTLRRVI